METLSDLYRLRRDIAESRQKPYIKSYDELHTFLISLHTDDQPYDLGFNEKMKFQAVPFYPDVVFGGPARVPGGEEFVHRICSIVDVVKGTEWRKDEGSDIANWNQVYKKGKGGWTPLRRLARGGYRCEPRHFSWWTTFPLFRDVISGAHRIGMTNNWVAEECVVLRCPVEYVNSHGLAYVPSVIDAFTQMIFHPTKHSSSPPHGVTIDLSLYPVTLSPGIDEVLLPGLPVDQLEIMPVSVDDEYRKGKNAVLSGCPVFRDLLKSYYENLV